MFKEIEIKIDNKKLVITQCDFKYYEDILEEIKKFIQECLKK